MACKLTRRPDGVFEGRTGSKVTIDLLSDRPARLTHLFYAGDQDDAAPFELRIKKGPQKLLVVALGVAGPDETQRMVIAEAGDPPCPLRLFFWTTLNFSTVLDIEGV